MRKPSRRIQSLLLISGCRVQAATSRFSLNSTCPKGKKERKKVLNDFKVIKENPCSKFIFGA